MLGKNSLGLRQVGHRDDPRATIIGPERKRSVTPLCLTELQQKVRRMRRRNDLRLIFANTAINELKQKMQAVRVNTVLKFLEKRKFRPRRERCSCLTRSRRSVQ